jgi:RNA polymerase sigma-70 factor (ECF subfamily)
MAVMAIPEGRASEIVALESSGTEALEGLFVGLVRDYHRRIYNYLLRLVGEEVLAEDLTQDTFLRAFRGLPKLPPGANYRAWLFRIATNAATDELRRRKRRPLVALGPFLRAPGTSEDQRLGEVVLNQGLLAIAPNHREILMLFELAEFSAPEVAEVLRISPEAARKRRQRAREALARELRARA